VTLAAPSQAGKRAPAAVYKYPAGPSKYLNPYTSDGSEEEEDSNIHKQWNAFLIE
jgi:hypothetical protein